MIAESKLTRAIIKDLVLHFAPGSELVYASDIGKKREQFESPVLVQLGVDMQSRTKMPDVVLHDAAQNRLFLVESATGHGPIDSGRRTELAQLFSGAAPWLIFVTAFPDHETMSSYSAEIAWGTEAWIADTPSHMIHFDGERLLGPYGGS